MSEIQGNTLPPELLLLVLLVLVMMMDANIHADNDDG